MIVGRVGFTESVCKRLFGRRPTGGVVSRNGWSHTRLKVELAGLAGPT